MRLNRIIIFSVLFLLSMFMWLCKPIDGQQTQYFRNLHDSVSMVGIQTCRSCHHEIYDSYIHTGMGRSFRPAHVNFSDARFDADPVYDPSKDLYYLPFIKDSLIHVHEFRLWQGDTVHSRIERIDYIVGSGHHTNSHLINRNGYLYQAPVTYYTQEGKWDLAPGFEDGENHRFDRKIMSECINCHNHLPKPASGSDHKYHEIPLGIECERCHGAGALHVNEKLAGNIIDTAKYTDYSIVNPSKLSIDLQMDICQRCHLQGIAVLNNGKTFYDYKPGMPLSEVMNVFLPRFTNSDKRFIMASQADRLKMSKCFTTSKALSCINCHNPHHDVHSTQLNQYNESCKGCHQQPKDIKCSAPASSLELNNNDCVFCHMPPSSSIDIPHVNITDHYISKHNIRKADQVEIDEAKKEEIAGFLGLKSLLKAKVSPLEMAEAYLLLYEKFMAQNNVLDSVEFYLNKCNTEDNVFKIRIHYLYAKQNWSELSMIDLDAANIQDAWTAYRIGQGHYNLNNYLKAVKYFEKATQLEVYNLDFQEKYAISLAKTNAPSKAEKIFDFILQQDDKRVQSQSNLGFLKAQRGKNIDAMQHFNRALELDPDHELTLLNKLSLLRILQRQEEMESLKRDIIRRFPKYSSRIENI